MSGFPLILAFVAAIVLMILAISKWKIHPFLSIMGISLVLGLVAGVPLVVMHSRLHPHRPEVE